MLELEKKIDSSKKIPYKYHSFKTKGGILCDEVGLGKSALLHTKVKNFEPFLKEMIYYVPCTLLICPSQLCAQWVKEIEKFSSLKVYLVTNNSTHTKLTYTTLKNYDIVIVSSQYMEGNYQVLLPLEDFINRKESRRRNNSTQKKTSVNQILQSTSVTFKSVFWNRIIFDEVHEFVQKNSLFYQSCIQLKGNYKWAVTGTPFALGMTSYNGILDILNVEYEGYDILSPLFFRNTKESVKNEFVVEKYVQETIYFDFSDFETALYKEMLNFIHYGDTIDDETLYDDQWKQLKQMCNHLQSTARFRSFGGSETKVLKPFKKLRDEMILFKKDELKKEIDENLKRPRNILVLTMEKKHKEIVIYNIQKKLEKLIEDEKTEKEKEKLEEIKTKISKNNSKLREKKTELNHMIKSIDTERNLMNSKMIRIEKIEKELEYFESIFLEIEKESICAICSDKPSDTISFLSCGHYFCSSCLSKWFKEQNNCPYCRSTNFKVIEFKVNDPLNENITKSMKIVTNSTPIHDKTLQSLYGTKLAGLLEFISKTINDSPSSKFVVFSQFKQILIYIGNVLEQYGILNSFIVGSESQRKKAIESFNSGELRVVMLTINNVASGVNLQIADHVIILDPLIFKDLNEIDQLEDQAIGRCYRIGQKSQLKVVRFIIKNTIEEQIEKYVNTKRQKNDPKKRKLEIEYNDEKYQKIE